MPVAEAYEVETGKKPSRGEDPAPAPGHKAGRVPAEYKKIHGWGADLDPRKRPMVPMELPSTVTNVRGIVKHRQVPQHKIHMSNEHPDLAPVFGTSAPPRGLSGMLRDYAYEYGEGTNRHWMTLLIADRVDMLEHDRKAMAVAATVLVGVVALGLLLNSRR